MSAHDGPRPDGPDAVTVAFSAPAADVHGVARLGVSEAGASGLLILFHRGEPLAVAAEGGVAVGGRPSGWGEVSVAGIDHATTEDGRAWTLQWAGDEGALDLELEALGAPGAVPDGVEQALRVHGGGTLGGARLALDGLGQRSRSWAAPDWERTELARTVQAWFGERAVSVAATRPAGRGHGDEALVALLLQDGGEPVVVPDPRLSTTFDADGRPRHAGLELWLGEDGPVHRAAGEVVCGTTLDLGRLRLDTAFLRWRMAGAEGTGRYDVLRRVG